jgi:hypothetical protein
MSDPITRLNRALEGRYRIERGMAQERSPLCRPYYQNPGRNGIRPHDR